MKQTPTKFFLKLIACLIMIGSAVYLLTSRCLECRTGEPFVDIVLPTIGLLFGLALAVVGLWLPSNALARRLARQRFDGGLTTCLCLAVLMIPLAFGLMLLGFHNDCRPCQIYWVGVALAFVGYLSDNRHAKVARLSRYGFCAVALCVLAVWYLPNTNLEAKRLLFGLGLRLTSPENGLAIGQIAAQPQLGKKVVIVFWTDCRCPKANLEQALRTLSLSQTPTIVTLRRRPEMSEWAPASPVFVVSRQTFADWGVDPSQTHVVLWINNGIVVNNLPASAFGTPSIVALGGKQ